jgi:transcription initiation factor TFIIIB Brf1 subunit/transcription initiation factor TFIIB
MSYLAGAEGLAYVTPESQDVGYDPYKEKYVQLVKDYAEYQIPQKVVELAAQIYMTVMRGIVRKRGRRKAMMCKCAYEAYKQNNVYKDPILLAQRFGIDVKKLRKAQDEFYDLLHEIDHYATFPRRQLSATDLLQDISQHMGLVDVPLAMLGDLIETLYQRSTLLHRTSSRDVAISVLHWYACESGNARTYEQTQKVTLVPKAKLVKNVGNIVAVMSSKL